MRHRVIEVIVGVTLCVVGMASASAAAGPQAGTPSAAAARPDHVVMVVMENHSYPDVIGSSDAPYINSLATTGASFDHSFAITHPSEPNYVALFSGSTQGLTDDSCPHTFTAANLGQELITAGETFRGYSESMPTNGYTGCTSGTYARKHSPWINFSNVPASSSLTYSEFPSDFTTLPTVSFVIPNLQNDMHDGTVQQGDTWLKNHIDTYAQWAKANNSLLVLTWDEDDNSQNNQIPTIFVGAGIEPGNYSESINHYNVLRTLEDLYGLPHAGASANAAPITDIWSGTTSTQSPGSSCSSAGSH